MDVTTTRLGDGGLEESNQECVLPPVVDSVSGSQLSYSSDSSLGDFPTSESTEYSQLQVSVLAVSGTFAPPELGNSGHHSSVGGQEEEE